MRQAEDRAHRQGQRQPVNIYFLCAKGTTDDRRWQHLNRSLARVAAVHDGAGLTPPAGAAGPAAGQESGMAQAGDEGAGGAAAVAAQAGLEVVCVHDAEEAGITPGAAKAGGWVLDSSRADPGGAGCGLRRDSFDGTQSGESPLPTAAVALMTHAVAAAAAVATEAPAEEAETPQMATQEVATQVVATQVAATQVAATPALRAGCCRAVRGAARGGFAAVNPVDCSHIQQQVVDLTTPSTTGSPVAPQPATSYVPATVSPKSGLCQGITDCGVVPAVDSGPAAAKQAEAASAAAAAAPVPQTAVAGANQAAALPAAPSSVALGMASPRAALPVAAALQVAPPVAAAAAAIDDVLAAAALALVQPSLKEAEPVQVWFEVSGNTSRVHLHTAADGSAPLLLSLPMEALLAGDSPSLDELLGAVAAHRQQDTQQGARQQCHEGSNPAAATQQPGPPPAVVGGIGVLALDCQLGSARLVAMLAEAREFAAEWQELRGLHQSRLQGKILRLPLQEVRAGV